MNGLNAKFLRVLAIIFMLDLITVSLAYAGGLQEKVNLICTNTTTAESMSPEEIDSLISDSDGLLKIVEASDDKRKKVHIIRLKRCRNFYDFIKQMRNK